jgi:hypothetical protein
MALALLLAVSSRPEAIPGAASRSTTTRRLTTYELTSRLVKPGSRGFTPGVASLTAGDSGWEVIKSSASVFSFL